MTALLLAALFGAVLGASARTLAPTVVVLAVRTRLLFYPVMLCGRMFPGLRVFRHRVFEVSGFELHQPVHPSHRGLVCHTFDKRKKHFGKTDEWRDFVSVTGGGNCRRAAAADAMGMNHRYLTKDELNEAIPPAYTRWIGAELLAYLKEAAA